MQSIILKLQIKSNYFFDLFAFFYNLTTLVLIFRFFKKPKTKNQKLFCPDGGIGRHVGLKNPWAYACAGSIPALGTIIMNKLKN